jgi:hypothetical protein
VDTTGNPVSSTELIANHLLKMLTSKKVLTYTVMNSKLQTKKADREHQRAEFTSLANGSNGKFSMMKVVRVQGLVVKAKNLILTISL